MSQEPITIPASLVAVVRDALEAGIENTRELLAKHDIELGREHAHNRREAERLVYEIGAMTTALSLLPKQ